MEEKNYNVNVPDGPEELLKKNRQLFKRYLSFFVVIFLIAASFYLGFNRGKSYSSGGGQAVNATVSLNEAILDNKTPSDKAVDFSLFWKVWDLVKEKHVDRDKLDAQAMVYGAINGMLHATGDPYSTFFSPKDTQSFSQQIGGSFEGIGAELGVKDDVLTVIAPLDGSPSQKAGLMAGDKIIKIDGKISTDLTIDQAVDMIRGKKRNHCGFDHSSSGRSGNQRHCHHPRSDRSKKRKIGIQR
jgi:carboxyl-terminal processing protease